MQTDPYLPPRTTLISKWIEDPNIKPDTLNLIKETVGNTLEPVDTEDFLRRTPIGQALRPTIKKWDLRKLRGFCTAEDTFIQTKQKSTKLNIYQLHI